VFFPVFQNKKKPFFSGVFGDPEALCKHLQTKTSDILGEWKQLNGGKDMIGLRSPVQKIFNICTYSWLNEKGRRETSHYDLQLNTFNFTLQSQNELKPVIRHKDVTIWIKMRTSCGNNKGPDMSNSIDGTKYDGEWDTFSCIPDACL
jgi:hypothetical protein